MKLYNLEMIKVEPYMSTCGFCTYLTDFVRVRQLRSDVTIHVFTLYVGFTLQPVLQEKMTQCIFRAVYQALLNLSLFSILKSRQRAKRRDKHTLKVPDLYKL